MSKPQTVQINKLMHSLVHPIALGAVNSHHWLEFPVETHFRVEETRIVSPRMGRMYLTGYYFLKGIVVHGKTLEDKHRNHGAPELFTYKDHSILLKEAYDFSGHEEPHFNGWIFVLRGTEGV